MPTKDRKRMGPEERRAARERWAAIGLQLLGDSSDGDLTAAEVVALGKEAIALIGATVRDRNDADDTPDGQEG